VPEPRHSPRPERSAEPLRTVADEAELLQISPRTLYVLVETGRVPFVRLGRSIRFEHQVVLEFMRESAR
jgi:excisionase family DNA binding protein